MYPNNIGQFQQQQQQVAGMTPDQIKEYFRKTFTLKGRIFFPNLLTSKLSQGTNPRKIFDVQFAWLYQENQQVFNEIKNFLAQVQNIVHPGVNPAALILPWKDHATYLRQDGRANPEYLKGHFWINPSTGEEFPPQVVEQTPMGLVQLTPADEAKMYSGRNAAINVSFYAMIPKQGAQNQKRGYGVNINACMILEGGNREGGAASVDVNSVFGGFAQDMGMNMAPPMGAPAQNFQQPAQAPQQQWAPPAQAPQQQWPQQNPQQGNGMNPGFPGTAMPGTPGQGQATHGNPAPGNAYPSNPGQFGAQPPWSQPAQQPAQAPQQQPFNPAFPNGNNGGYV